MKKVDRSEVFAKKAPVITPNEETDDNWDDVTDWIDEENVDKKNLSSKANLNYSKNSRNRTNIRKIRASIQDEEIRKKFDEVMSFQHTSRFAMIIIKLPHKRESIPEQNLKTMGHLAP